MVYFAILAYIVTLSQVGPVSQVTNLQGVVKNSDGRPVPGAVVRLIAACDRIPEKTICPTCYDDCGRYVTTDSQGAFCFQVVDQRLLFDLKVVLRSSAWKIFSGLDPRNGNHSLTVPTAVDSAVILPTVRGTVYDKKGSVVAGAMLTLISHEQGPHLRIGSGGYSDFLVTDSNGEFKYIADKKTTTATFRVEAKSFARLITPALSVDASKNHVIVLDVGQRLSGRLSRRGMPLAGISIRLIQDHSSHLPSIGHQKTLTNTDGEFEFAHVASGQTYLVHGSMNQFAEHAFAFTAVRVKVNDQRILPLSIEANHAPATLRLKLVTTDGKPLDARSSVSLCCDATQDGSVAHPSEDGLVVFSGIPPEAVRIESLVKGYRFSRRNVSQDPIDPSTLLGLVTANATLTIELEPGPPLTVRDFIGSKTQDLQALRAIRARTSQLRKTELAGIE